MWIFCCGMPRSGSTVQYQLTKEIVETQLKGKALGHVSLGKFDKMYHQYHTKNEYVVLKCHGFPPAARQLFAKGEGKAIYVYRDIRDVVVSKLNKRQFNFEKVNVSHLLKKNLRRYYQWQSVDDILVSKYEEMIEDLQREAIRIGDYLGLHLTEQFVEQLAQKYSMEKQKQRIANFDYQNYGIETKVGVYYDPESLLHDNHIYSGKSEQWKSELSSLQVAFIEAKAGDWLVDRGYHLSQGWLKRTYSIPVVMLKHLMSR